MPISAGVVTVAYDGDLELFTPSADLVVLADGTLLTTVAGTPVDAVQGTGYGTADAGALYVKTVGKVLYKNAGDAGLPAWVAAGGTDRSGAGAPEDGVTAGDTGDYYSDTDAYGIDPKTGWYVCTDGDEDTWAAVTATVLSGAGTPVDAVVGTGAGLGAGLCVDLTGRTLYEAGGTVAHPTWTAA